MNVNAMIIKALEGFGYPVVYGTYTGEATTYISFGYETYPDDYANDAPEHEVYLIDVHLFCPREMDTVKLCAQIKRALADAGLEYPGMLDAEDEDGKHFVFETKAVGGTDGAD